MKAMRRAARLSSEERKAMTVRTVIDLAGECDPAEITTSAIAERMAMTQGALFRHFPTKDEMWQAVVGWGAERLLERLDKAAASAETPLVALEAIFFSHLRFVRRHAGIPRIVLNSLQRAGDTPTKSAVRALLSRYGERLRALLEEAKTRGEVAADVDTAAAVALFMGTVQTFSLQMLMNKSGVSIEDLAAKSFALFVRGIRSAK